MKEPIAKLYDERQAQAEIAAALVDLERGCNALKKTLAKIRRLPSFRLIVAERKKKHPAFGDSLAFELAGPGSVCDDLIDDVSEAIDQLRKGELQWTVDEIADPAKRVAAFARYYSRRPKRCTEAVAATA
jgi:hypothetical protein